MYPDAAVWLVGQKQNAADKRYIKFELASNKSLQIRKLVQYE